MSKEGQKDITPRAEVLREAESLITGDRNETYGTPTENFTNIAELITTRFRHKLKDGETITATDVADIQILVKIARNIAQTKRDNFVDIAGYAACGYETTIDDKPEAVTGVVPPAEKGTWTPFIGGGPGAGGITINNHGGGVNSSKETVEQIARRVQEEINFSQHRYGQTSRGRD